MQENLTHFDKNGNAIMVDVSNKEETYRVAVATGKIIVSSKVMEAIVNKKLEKGDVLGVARVAGIMATKQTALLIPMCHNILITKSTIDFELDNINSCINVTSTVKTQGKTGVEMEAMTGVSVALLTIYDMCKAIDKMMEISNIQLLAKSGGKSGDFIR